MKPSEFEEKEFENPLCNQLLDGTNVFWTPGQVIENHLGFDQALFTTCEYLWRLHGYTAPLGGLTPFRYWPWVRASPPQQNRLPPFQLNCFIQAKRASKGVRRSKTLIDLHIGTPYYRFDVAADQQKVLARVATALAGQALFVYAAPVFCESQRLFHLQTIGQLVENSTFPAASTLVGHSAWYYSQAGATGAANPDFVYIESPGIMGQLAAIAEPFSRDGAEASVAEGLAGMATAIRSAIGQLAEAEATARTGFLADDWRLLSRDGAFDAFDAVYRDYATVATFALRFNLRWLVVDPHAI